MIKHFHLKIKTKTKSKMPAKINTVWHRLLYKDVHHIQGLENQMILVLIVTISTNQDIETHLLNLPVKL